MLTLSAIQRNPIIKEIYEERTSKGMEKMAAIGLCRNKGDVYDFMLFFDIINILPIKA